MSLGRTEVLWKSMKEIRPSSVGRYFPFHIICRWFCMLSDYPLGESTWKPLGSAEPLTEDLKESAPMVSLVFLGWKWGPSGPQKIMRYSDIHRYSVFEKLIRDQCWPNHQLYYPLSSQPSQLHESSWNLTFKNTCGFGNRNKTNLRGFSCRVGSERLLA